MEARKQMLGELSDKIVGFGGTPVDILDLIKAELTIAFLAISATAPFTVLFETDAIEEDEEN